MEEKETPSTKKNDKRFLKNISNALNTKSVTVLLDFITIVNTLAIIPSMVSIYADQSIPNSVNIAMYSFFAASACFTLAYALYNNKVIQAITSVINIIFLVILIIGLSSVHSNRFICTSI